MGVTTLTFHKRFQVIYVYLPEWEWFQCTIVQVTLRFSIFHLVLTTCICGYVLFYILSHTREPEGLLYSFKGFVNTEVACVVTTQLGDSPSYRFGHSKPLSVVLQSEVGFELFMLFRLNIATKDTNYPFKLL